MCFPTSLKWIQKKNPSSVARWYSKQQASGEKLGVPKGLRGSLEKHFLLPATDIFVHFSLWIVLCSSLYLPQLVGKKKQLMPGILIAHPRLRNMLRDQRNLPKQMKSSEQQDMQAMENSLSSSRWICFSFMPGWSPLNDPLCNCVYIYNPTF